MSATVLSWGACLGAAEGTRPRERDRGTRTRRGFTLIELLVVIAIIALLVSILVPSLKRAREIAKATVCSVQVKTFGNAMQYYASDYASALPWCWNSLADDDAYGSTGGHPGDGSGGGYGGFTWALLLYPYVENINGYECPSFGWDRKPSMGQTNGHDWIYAAHFRVNPYLGNYGYWGGYPYPLAGRLTGPFGNWTFRPAKLDQINRPSEKVGVFDSYNYHSPYILTPQQANHYFQNHLGDGDRTNTANYDQDNYPHYFRPNIGSWHDGLTNMAYMDGHYERHDKDSRVLFEELDDAVHWSLYD